MSAADIGDILGLAVMACMIFGAGVAFGSWFATRPHDPEEDYMVDLTKRDPPK